MIYEKNAFEIYSEAEALDAKWQKKWSLILKIIGIPFLFAIAGGLIFQSEICGYICVFCFLTLGIAAGCFVGPQQKVDRMKKLAIKLYGTDDEEY